MLNNQPNLQQAKAYATVNLKNDLLFWNMNMHETRKVTCKRVKVGATVRDRNLWTSQGTMYWTEIYNDYGKSLPAFTKLVSLSSTIQQIVWQPISNDRKRW